MTDFQLLAKGIALAGCAIGAGAALIGVYKTRERIHRGMLIRDY